jgi:hypothetical protein
MIMTDGLENMGRNNYVVEASNCTKPLDHAAGSSAQFQPKTEQES